MQSLFVCLIAAAASLPTDAPAPQRVVSLSEALTQAFDRNVSVVIAHQEVLRVEGLLREVRALSLPTILANGTYLRLDADRVFNGSVILGANQFSANIVVNAPLIFPARWAQWIQASDQREIAKFSVQDQRRLIALSVGRSYLTIIAQKRVLEVSTRAVDTGRLQVKFAEQRFKGGVGTKIDRLRAEQELALAEQQQTNAYVSLTRSQEALGILLGENQPVDAKGDDLPDGTPSLQEALASTHDRADWKLAERRQKAATRARGQVWTEYMPNVIGVFQPFYQNPPTLTQPQWGWQAQIILSIPVYDGGARYGRGEQRRAVEAQATAQMEQMTRTAESEVRVAYEAVKRADLALAAAQKSAALAREARELANVAYTSGAATSLEVIDAERRARDADTQAAVAEDTARQARLELLAASGKFP